MVPEIAHIYATESVLPNDSIGWLSPSEQEAYELRPKRARRSWLAGRILAKKLLREFLAPHAPPPELEIHSRDGLGRGIRPQVFLHGRVLPASLSISHANDLVLTGLGLRPGLLVGVDIAAGFQPRQGLIDLSLTPAERTWLEAGGCTFVALWTIKEAVYKATNRGEPFSPASIGVRASAHNTYAFTKADRSPAVGHAHLVPLAWAMGAIVAYDPSLQTRYAI